MITLVYIKTSLWNIRLGILIETMLQLSLFSVCTTSKSSTEIIDVFYCMNQYKYFVAKVAVSTKDVVYESNSENFILEIR